MKISVWYHAKTSGKDFGVNTDYSLSVIREQMRVAGSLIANANDFTVGINGDEESFALAKPLLPAYKIIHHGVSARSELPTLNALQQWLPGHEDYYVCYFHSKGITHPYDELVQVWRRCMDHHVIRNWKNCVRDLDSGCDMAGAHWLTREQYGPMVNTFFWGGNFWWAKASFLKDLPPLPSTSTCRDQDFLAELWIGQGRRPVVRDYAPHWPGIVPCSHNRKCFLTK